MDLLPKGHPRFCAKYVAFVEIVESPQKGAGRTLRGINMEYILSRSSSGLKVGDIVFIAKRMPTLRSQPQKWAIHKIVLAEAYWMHQHNVKLTPKEQRVRGYSSYPETHFGHNTYLAEAV